MPHGNRNRNNGAFRSGPPHGRGGMGQGRGRGRGGNRGRGRARAFVSSDELHREDGTLFFEGDFKDFTLDLAEPDARKLKLPKQINNFEGKQTVMSTALSPPSKFGGRSTRQKVLRGIERPTSVIGHKVPISVLERERPLLQPIKFVKGEHVKTLFEEVEEILHVPGEGVQTLDANAPSNDIIEKIFHHDISVQDLSDLDNESEVEAHIGGKLEKKVSADFMAENIALISTQGDIGQKEIIASSSQSPYDVEGFESHAKSSGLELDAATNDQADLWFVDTCPCPVLLESGSGDKSSTAATCIAPLGQIPAEDDVIVYEAPNPRISRATTPNIAVDPPKFDTVSLSFTEKRDPEKVLSATVRTHKFLGLKATPRSHKMAKKQQAARNKRRRFSMISMGLNHENLTTLKERSTAKQDCQRSRRRTGDSDIDWGVEDEDGAVEEVRYSLEDMELDPDLADVDIATLTRFANGVNGLTGDTFLTIDDLADIQRMQAEDTDTASGLVDESDEMGEILNSSVSSEDEDSNEDTPRTSFQNRLKRLREQKAAKEPADDSSSGEDEGNRDGFGKGLSWNDQSEFLDGIDQLIAENEDILRGDRKSRKKLFKAIAYGSFDDAFDISLNSTKKSRHIPVPLQDQWERDRQKKAQRKRERELARLQEAINASPSGRGKLQKKKRKLLAQGGLTVDGETLHIGDVDTLAMLESLMRRFLASLEFRIMVIPPKDKEFRRRAHCLANAFNIKSVSQGKDEKRFTTFTKISRSGININETKVSTIIRGEEHRLSGQASGRTPRVHIIRQRDGEIVGKAAPRLNDSNIGFKLLQQMGWTEGERIGVTGGLSDPLAAVIKTTKLGLGAVR